MEDTTNDEAIREIREALGVSDDECNITNRANCYIIEPRNCNKKLSIKQLDGNIFKHNLHFKNCSFKCDIYFGKPVLDIVINNDIVFEQCIFKNEVSWNELSLNKIILFQSCTFQGGCSFKNNTFRETVSFKDSTFEYGVSFMGSNFEGKVSFSNSIFQDKISFLRANFKDSAYFDNTIFKDEVIFSLSNFNKDAYFYGTTFEKFPDFLQVIFNGNVNFTNTELNIDFDKAGEKIEEIYNAKEEAYNNAHDKKERKEPKRYKIANEFRDSFRNIKSALIEHHNMLDASNYHRVELYCKELELEYKKKEEPQNSTTRDFIDKIQLYCYRVTSDHHTDLLLILNNIIFLIALFGVANLVLVFLNQFSIIQFAFLAIDDIKLLEITICIICVAAIMSVMLNYYSIIYFIIFSPIFALVSYINSIYAIFILLMLCVFAVYLMILLYFQSELKGNFTKKIFFVISYPIVILMLIFKPSLILPILGKLLENKTHESCLFVFDKIKLICFSTTSTTSETLNLIYMLFLFLLLFSLQKTARKNTIVPS